MLRTCALATFVLFVGCSGGDDHHDTTDAGDSGAIGCLTDPRAETWTAGMKKAGAAGKLQFQIVSGDPAPPLRGNNTWTVNVLDDKGAVVPTATLTAEPFMPDHGHGTSIDPLTTANADGSIKVSPLNFFMPGLWRITLTAKAGDVTDSAAFFFCVAG